MAAAVRMQQSAAIVAAIDAALPAIIGPIHLFASNWDPLFFSSLSQ